MIVVDPGHEYLLKSLSPKKGGTPAAAPVKLTFVKRKGDRYPGNLTMYHGTTSQEVLRALIDRAQYVNGQIPCWQTRLSVTLMRLVIWLYEHRAAKVHKRWFFAPVEYIEHFPTCLVCGHIECKEAHDSVRGGVSLQP